MTVLPSQPVPSGLAATAARSAFEAQYVLRGCQAVYRPKGGGSGTVVRVVIVPVMPKAAGIDGRGSSLPVTTNRMARISALGWQAGDTESSPGTGVSAAGNIKTLSVGDDLRVPGWAVDQPAVAEIVVRVTGGVFMSGAAVWHGEVMP